MCKINDAQHQTLAKAEAKLTELADTLARGKTRRSHSKVTAAIDQIVKDPWVRRVIAWQLTGDTPAAHRLTWSIQDTALRELKDEVDSAAQFRHAVV